MAPSSSFHPNLAVTNVKNFIPITLEMEKVQYSSRAELFKIHFHVYQVLNHIIPPTKTLTATAQAIIKDVQAAEIDPELWSHLDAVVL